MKAIRSLRSHIYAENYSPEIAAVRAVKIMYITVCMLNDIPFEKIEDSSLYENEKYIGNELRHLKYLRKMCIRDSGGNDQQADPGIPPADSGKGTGGNAGRNCRRDGNFGRKGA